MFVLLTCWKAILIGVSSQKAVVAKVTLPSIAGSLVILKIPSILFLIPAACTTNL